MSTQKQADALRKKLPKAEQERLNEMERGSFLGKRPVVFDDKRKKGMRKDGKRECRRFLREED